MSVQCLYLPTLQVNDDIGDIGYLLYEVIYNLVSIATDLSIYITLVIKNYAAKLTGRFCWKVYRK